MLPYSQLWTFAGKYSLARRCHQSWISFLRFVSNRPSQLQAYRADAARDHSVPPARSPSLLWDCRQRGEMWQRCFFQVLERNDRDGADRLDAGKEISRIETVIAYYFGFERQPGRCCFDVSNAVVTCSATLDLSNLDICLSCQFIEWSYKAFFLIAL